MQSPSDISTFGALAEAQSYKLIMQQLLQNDTYGQLQWKALAQSSNAPMATYPPSANRLASATGSARPQGGKINIWTLALIAAIAWIIWKAMK